MTEYYYVIDPATARPYVRIFNPLTGQYDASAPAQADHMQGHFYTSEQALALAAATGSTVVPVPEEDQKAELASTISDVSKDVHGFRMRITNWREWTVAELQERLDDLQATLEEQLVEEGLLREEETTAAVNRAQAGQAFDNNFGSLANLFG